MIRQLLFRTLPALHVLIYQLSGGRVGNSLAKLPILLLKTTGRKSHKERTTPLVYFRDGASYVLVASFGGSPTNPAWFHNLETNPQVRVRVKRATKILRARRGTPSEKARIWPSIIEKWPNYDAYQKKTTRDIPLVMLDSISARSVAEVRDPPLPTAVSASCACSPVS